MKTIKENIAFIIPYILFLLMAGIFLFSYSKGDAHLILNQYRYAVCDSIFCYATWLGDFFAVIAIVFLLCLDRKSTRLNSSHIQKSRMPSSA